MFTAAAKAYSKAMNKGLELKPPTRLAVAHGLYDWLATRAKTRVSSPEELLKNLDQWKPALERMADKLKIEVSSTKIRISAEGPDEERTLTLLERGSSWFDPHPRLAQAIMEIVTSR